MLCVIIPNPSYRYKLDKTIITTDLTKERPLWNLSCYGPGRNAPSQLFGGAPRELSFEEMRLRHYELAASGKQQQAIQEAQALLNEAEQQNNTALKNITGAIQYIVDGENRHPNRHDICKSKGADPAKLQGFSGSTAAFGQPSTSGTQPQGPTSAFGGPSTSAFGQPSTLGQQTSSLGQPASTFGQPSFFRQPSMLGRPIGQTNPTFGQPSNPVSAFRNSPFVTAQGQSTTGTNQATHPFGQPSFPAPKNPFSQPIAPATTTNFGQLPSSQSSNVFGTLAAPQPQNPFNQPTTAKANPFSQPTITRPTTLFGKTPMPVSSFGQASIAPSTVAFIQPSIPAPTTAFGQPSISKDAPYSSPGQTAKNARRDTSGKLVSWKGKPVSYISDIPCYEKINGIWEKIWFQDGPPAFLKNEILPEADYDEGTKEAYLVLKQTGRFKGGIIPQLPPKREWLTWDF